MKNKNFYLGGLAAFGIFLLFGWGAWGTLSKNTVSTMISDSLGSGTTHQFAVLGIGAAPSGGYELDVTGNLRVSSTSQFTDQIQVIASKTYGILDIVQQNSGKQAARIIGNISIGSSGLNPTNGKLVLMFENNGVTHPTMPDSIAGLHAYEESGVVELFASDEASNHTQLTSHDGETGKWIFYSKNSNTGRVLRIEMEELIFDLAKEISDKTGKQYIYESKPLRQPTTSPLGGL